MNNTIFSLNIHQLKSIAEDLSLKIEEGLSLDNQEIACLPTYINPIKDYTQQEGSVLVLDWGGTHFRASIVEYKKGQNPKIIENRKIPLSSKETKGFSREQLFETMADLINQLKELDYRHTTIGYCFSYPACSTIDGDAVLLQWTKRMEIPGMVNKLVGKPLLQYLNDYKGIRERTRFEKIKVVNDTVASLFAGLTQPEFDNYLGLIVGTGFNTAAFIPDHCIEKLDKRYTYKGLVPVNLESGNLIPVPGTPMIEGQYFTLADQKVDQASVNKGRQIIEKTVSGGYIGEVFQKAIPDRISDSIWGGDKINYMLNNPEAYNNKEVEIARSIYRRSAQLVAATLAGLISVLVRFNNTEKRIGITAEGSLFWSHDKEGTDYKIVVDNQLKDLLKELNLNQIRVEFIQTENVNIIGTSIAALS